MLMIYIPIITITVGQCCFTCDNRGVYGQPKTLLKCMITGDHNSRFATCKKYIQVKNKSSVKKILRESVKLRRTKKEIN